MLWTAAGKGDKGRCKKAIDDGADINCHRGKVSFVYIQTINDIESKRKRKSYDKSSYNIRE